MYPKTREVKQLINKEFSKFVKEAFGQLDATRTTGLRTVYEKATEQARKCGASILEETEQQREPKSPLKALKDTGSAESF